tara:strand:+ start:117 stop:362 length:246 start_codon:yes stop_codon:yes gene_type:complete
MKKNKVKRVSGNLVTIVPGQYLRVKTKSPTDFPFVGINNESKAVLVEHQGHDHERGLECWSVLVGDNLLLAWQDQFIKNGV